MLIVVDGLVVWVNGLLYYDWGVLILDYGASFYKFTLGDFALNLLTSSYYL
jgi:hypothetical protein